VITMKRLMCCISVFENRSMLIKVRWKIISLLIIPLTYIRLLEWKYEITYEEFDTKTKTQGPRYKEEDDWIDWGDLIDLVQGLLKIRGDVNLINKDLQSY